jgi:excisionase family DNA binding protein
MLPFIIVYVTIMACMLLKEIKFMNYLTVEEFAKRIKMHPGSVRRSIRQGKIFATRPSMGKRGPYRIAESELERLFLQGMCENKN